MDFIKKNYKYLILFLYFFVCLNFIYTVNRGDAFVNYGFSYAISRGEVPYLDFNMVITPFSPIFYSIFLIFSKSIVFYYLGQSLLLCIMYYFSSKILKNKSILLLLFMIIPFPIPISTMMFPGYNFLLLLLFILLIYFSEKKYYFYMGIVLGLIICTKQTIGLVMSISLLYYLIKDRKIFIKQLEGEFIPILLLVLYLVITGSFNNFIDLCFLGLFRFSNNSSISIYYLILFILGEVILIIKYLKNKSMINFYPILFSSIVLPIIDFYHVSLFLFIVMFMVLRDFKLDRNITKYIILLIVCVSSCSFMITKSYLGNFVISNFNNFEFSLFGSNYYNDCIKLNKYTSNLSGRVIYLLRGSENYFYKIINNKNIDYFDLPNSGNYGYNGEELIVNKIISSHKTYYVLDRDLIRSNEDIQQYIKEFSNTVIKNSKKVKSISVYDIYYKE